MPTETTRPPEGTRTPFEEKVRNAATQVEDDLRRVVGYINDEVMPDVRKNGSQALRFAAGELRKLAERMDDANRTAPPPPPPGKG